MIIGILVVYSEDYFIKSLIEFDRVLKLTARKYQLIVVFNNHDLASKLDSFVVDHVNFETVLGSNQFHEFSGWCEGLGFIKKKYPSQYRELDYIFCNDTFCQHRTYTFFHRLIFSACCTLSFLSYKPTVAGEVNSIGKDFEFNHSKFNTWVSSYFFSVNKEAINLINFDILPSTEIVNSYLLGGHDEKCFFSEAMDLTLKKHLLNWLFRGGWYKSEKLSQTNKTFFYKKARSIMAEFYLSSNLHKNKIDLLDTYYLIKLINRLRCKF